ncbi:MAG: TrkH family potassium uptake protein [Ruminococcus sp.]|nr:TrkH family potassium uptake protein [Ruminococcus sp.]
MNLRNIGYILGCVIDVEGVFMLMPFICGLIYGEGEAFSFALVAVICLIVGTLLILLKPKNMSFSEREGVMTVALCWIVLSLFGAIPFVINGDIPSYLNALFETVSGFTTTGASILDDVEALSHASLFWRNFTNWIGGMGVLVFLLAFLPLKGGTHMYLMKAESPGPSVEKFVPNVRGTAMILYGIYVALSVIEFVFLLFGDMPLFDCICTVFGTAGTGGFAVRNASMAAYSPYVQWVVAVFMMLFGVNFSVYFLLIMRKFKQSVLYEEIRWYFGIIVVSCVIIVVNCFDNALSLADNIRNAFFQVTSVISSTGFSTVDFNLWHSAGKTVLVLVMFVGACAGSTGGGIKVSRIIIMAKSIKKELLYYAHPKSVWKIKFCGKVVEHEVIRTINVFFITYVLIYALSLLIISFDDASFETNFTAVVATLNNIGPGLGQVGPTGNFNFFSPLSKIVLMFNMLAGRLELYPLLLVFSVKSWKEGITDAAKGVSTRLHHSEKPQAQ